MKIRINSEPYIANPAPKLTKQMFDWFWTTLWSLRLEYYTPSIETIEIRINQALSNFPIHFYITINGIYEFHKEWDGRSGKYLSSYTRSRILMQVIDSMSNPAYRKYQVLSNLEY